MPIQPNRFQGWGDYNVVNLSIGFITSRPEPQFAWFVESLFPQIQQDDKVEIVVIDLRAEGIKRLEHEKYSLVWAEPKSNPWQGRDRLTNENWWAKSSAMNTFFCLASHEFVALIDDRCVVLPGWLSAIKDAQRGDYAVNGTYQKRSGMVVENGIITHPGTTIGLDQRTHMRELTYTYGGAWYGSNFALPLEWCLEMNGAEERADGIGGEDTIFGNRLCANGHRTAFDPKMKVIQDRTQPDAGTPVRTDKDPSPNDKSHKLLELYGGGKLSHNASNIRVTREMVQAGNPFPHHGNAQTTDWYDNQPLSEMTVR